MAIIYNTGFLKGLYSETEMSSENIKEKEKKVAFLNKLIEAIKCLTGEDLAVRSSKIIAGLEPTQTNLLLQAIGKALDDKIDSNSYVQQLKSDKKSTKDNSKVKKSRNSDRVSKNSNESIESVRNKRKSSLKPSPKESKTDEIRKAASSTRIKNEGNQEKIKKVERKSSSSKSKENLIEPKIKSSKAKEKRTEPEELEQNLKEVESVREIEVKEPTDIEETLKVETPVEVPASSTEKSEKSLIQPPLQSSSESRNSPRINLRPPSVRPSSARPGAPRLRTDPKIPMEEVVPMGGVNVIVENYSSKTPEEEEEDDSVVIQIAPEIEAISNPLPANIPADKGHLVEQILRQMKEDEGHEHSKTLVDIEWDQNNSRNKNATIKEIEFIKSAIQNFTKTANPLGKLINYLHEDIETMHAEIDKWINLRKQISADILVEQKATIEFNEVLQGKLVEIDESIRQQNGLILSLDSTILQNEAHIQTLLTNYFKTVIKNWGWQRRPYYRSLRNLKSNMSDHLRTVFNNSCLRVPRHPCNNRPAPVFEQQFYSSINNIKSTMDSDKSPFKSLTEFYDSIPEYDDVNHLTNREFYRKISLLKERQKEFWENLQKETKIRYKRNGWVEDYAKFGISNKSSRPSSCILREPEQVHEKRMSAIKRKFPSTSSLNTKYFNMDSPYSHKDKFCTSITTPNSNKSLTKDAEWIDNFKKLAIDFKPESSMKAESDVTLSKESVSNTERMSDLPQSLNKTKPMVGWKENGITVPKPFTMTVRDEENKIIDEIVLDIKNPEKGKEKCEMFRAHPVPIQSKIPLYDKIITDQEIRSMITKERRKKALKAQMRPFSFTRREEEMNAICKRFSLSTPSLTYDDKPIKVKKFKAKPIPKNLFSNYAYRKMHEDEFYRALQRKIRAEEMLKASQLPPSMAKREKFKPKTEICPKSFLYVEDDSLTKSRKQNPYQEDIEREFQHLKNDLTHSPRSYHIKSSKLNEKRLRKCYGGRRSTSSTTLCKTPELLTINRSNLAAVLRIQSAKKKQEMQLMRRLEEAKLKQETRWREKVLRKKPAWQTIAYDNEEDLAMRLELRREEERLRSEQHRHRMELMYGRVNKIPLLFERQTQKSLPITRQQLIDQLYNECKCNTKLTESEITDETPENKNLIEEVD